MKARSNFLIISIVLLGLLLFAPSVIKAQEETIDGDDLETLEGIEIEETKSIPTGFGFWWRDISEWTSLALTLDPVKKAEKQLKFAEERMKLADYIMQNSTDPKIQEKANNMLEKANQYMQKIEGRKDKLIEKADEKSRRLLDNVAKHYLNKERILEKIEDKISPEKIEEFQQMRETNREKQQNFLNNLQDNSNVPQEVKDRVENVLLRVKNMEETREEFRLQQKKVLDEMKTGEVSNEEAKIQFEELRQERQQKMEQTRKNNSSNN